MKNTTQIASPPNPKSLPRPKSHYWQRLLAAGLTLALAFLFQSAHAAPALVGEWFDGATNFSDVSGYTPSHDGFLVGGSDYAFTNDVPPGKSGYSIFFTFDDTGIAITNSSTLDLNYDDTFDAITNEFTVTCWGKWFPNSWDSWVSKFGESTNSGAAEGNNGWQLREDGSTGEIYSCFTVRNGPHGTVVLGTAVYGSSDDMATRTVESDDGAWHLYAGVFNAYTGVRSLYVDGVLAAEETNNTPDYPAPAEHVCINAKDNPPGDDFTSFSTNEIFDVRIYNYALTQSEVAQLYGELPPTISAQPNSPFYADLGSNAQFSVVHFTGTQPFTFQWQLDQTNLVNGASYSGVNSNILTIFNASASDNGTYTLLVSNSVSNTVSSNVVFFVQATALVGEWLNGASNYNDVSGFSDAGTHDGFIQGTADAVFTNDPPPGYTGLALYFPNGDSCLAITNSSTLDSNYDNTFDAPLENTFSVTVWAKGVPSAAWTPWATKFGETENGWQMRTGSENTEPSWTVRDNSAGTYTLGNGPTWDTGGDQDDMEQIGFVIDGNWHLYAGTFNAATGVRDLYIDGLLQAQETGNVQYNLAQPEHVCIMGKDSPPGNSFGNFATGEIFDLRIYNYPLNQAQVEALLGSVAPRITEQPQSLLLYPGETATLTAGGIASPSAVTYQWLMDNTNLVNSANVSGANSNVLTIVNLAASDAGTYQLIVSNNIGATYSSNATVALAPLPAQGTFAAAVLSNSPLAYWILNETNDPANGGVIAYDRVGGYNGIYDANAQDEYNGIFGPSLPGFPASQGALGTQIGVAASYVSAATPESWVASNLTCAMWIYPTATPDTFTGLFMDRSAPSGGDGFGFVGNDATLGVPTLGYTWNGNSGDTWGWDSHLAPPVNEWSFVAWTITPRKGVVYLVNSNGISSATNAIAHDTEEFGVKWNMGNDQNNATGTLTFPGTIADVSLYLTALSGYQVEVLYDVAEGITPPPPTPTLAAQVIPGPHGGNTGGSLVLTWSAGNLLEATNLAGPWTTNTSTSPYTNAMTNAELFFKAVNP